MKRLNGSVAKLQNKRLIAAMLSGVVNDIPLGAFSQNHGLSCPDRIFFRVPYQGLGPLSHPDKYVITHCYRSHPME